MLPRSRADCNLISIIELPNLLFSPQEEAQIFGLCNKLVAVAAMAVEAAGLRHAKCATGKTFSQCAQCADGGWQMEIKLQLQLPTSLRLKRKQRGADEHDKDDNFRSKQFDRMPLGMQIANRCATVD